MRSARASATPLITALLVLVEKLLDLGLNGLLEHLLSTAANQLVKQFSPLELLSEIRDFRIDTARLWHFADKLRTFDHGVSFQPLLGSFCTFSSQLGSSSWPK